MAVTLDPSALATLDNLKTELGITGSSQDDRLKQIINRVSAWIEGNTNRKLKARNYGEEEVFDTTDVPSEEAIVFSGSTLDCGGDTVVNPHGYQRAECGSLAS